MKALSIASLFALAVAGTACSQASEPETEKADAESPPAETTEVDASEFNLGLPTDLSSADTTTASDGFNLALPGTSATSSDEFNLGTDLSTADALSDIPEIDAGVGEEQTEEEPEEDADDEPVIRLD